MRSSFKFFPVGAAATLSLMSVVRLVEAQPQTVLTLSTAPAGTTASGAAAQSSADPLQLGLFGGIMVLPSEATLREPGSPLQDFEDVAPEIGLRLGAYPIQYLGAELEGAYLPTGTPEGRSAKIFGLRGHLIAQVPTRALTPFLLAGVGGLFLRSNVLGDDDDPGIHFGLGVKLPMGDAVALRIDLRDTVMTNANDDVRHYPEFLFGLGIGFGGERQKPVPPPPPDSDGDGISDDADSCPQEVGNPPDGCPVRDSDSDGVLDDVDKCPEVAGIAPDGCPDPDPDRDGVLADADKCPEVAGIAPDGCPDPDPDRDGVLADADKCPEEPETRNGFEDEDGCPDELPEKVKQFTGVIQGIEFDFGKVTVRKTSLPTLDAAILVLKEFPNLRIKITGHTDSVGTHEVNMERSAGRAAAVRDYMVEQGIDTSRIETQGAGPDSPIADNKTEAGRQKNRRIEFEILK